MNIDKIMEFFYEKASKRIKERVGNSTFTRQQIYKRDCKQISWIINNKRTKNNRFLICDAVLDSYEGSENFGLIPKLNFNNCQEVLWGADNEITYYLPDLFKLLWDEISIDDNKFSINRELYLSDYIPYAKYSTYWDILFSPHNKYPALYYGVREDDVIESIDSSREEAFEFLYAKCKYEFSNIFNEFVNSTTSFHKINKVFQHSFIEQSFLPMLLQFKPTESSLGLRVKELILSDLSKCAELLVNANNTNSSNKFQSLLINASSTYVVSLEEIQALYIKELLI